MITQIRKGLQSRSVRLLISALIIGTFAFSALIVLWQYATERKSNWILKINGTPISAALYHHERRQQEQLIENLRAQYGDLAPLLLQMSGLPTDVSSLTEQSLIQSTLLNEQAQEAGIMPSPAYVQEQIAHPEQGLRHLAQVMPIEVLTRNGVDNERLARYLTRMGLGSGELEQLLEQSFARSMLLGVVSALTYVPQFYLDHERMLRTAQRSISFAVAPITPSNEPISQDALEKFYQNELKKGAYTTPEKRAAKVWRFDPDSYDINVSSKQARDFYERNKQTFIEEPARLSIAYAIFTPNEQFGQDAVAQAAQELHDVAVTAPDRFEELVIEAQQHGIGVQFEKPDPIERGELVDRFGKEFDRRIFALPADKSIAPMIDTPEGIVIVQRLSKQKRRYKSFEDVEDDIHAQIREERFAKRFTADAQTHTLSDDPESFDLFVSKHKAKEQEIALHEQGKNRYDQYLFATKQGDRVPFVDGQVGVIIEVTEIEPAHAQEFSAIKKQIEDDFRLTKGRAALQKKVAALSQELKDNPTALEERAKQSGFTMHTIILSAVSAGDTAKELAQYGIDPEQLLGLHYPGSLTSSQDSGDSEDYVYIARLDTLSEVSREERTDEQEADIGAYVQHIARAVQNGYVATLRKNATIEVNSSLPLSS